MQIFISLLLSFVKDIRDNFEFIFSLHLFPSVNNIVSNLIANKKYRAKIELADLKCNECFYIYLCVCLFIWVYAYIHVIHLCIHIGDYIIF